MPNITRHEKREAVFQLLFEAEFHPEKTAEEIYELAVAERDVHADPFIRDEFTGARAASSALDEKIGQYANNWKVTRMTNVARSILRLAIYELTETPPRVVIDEAVELAKTFDDAESPAFVNGILNRFAREGGFIKDEQSTDAASDET